MYLFFQCKYVLFVHFPVYFISTVVIPHEEVVSQLAADTLSTGAQLGLTGSCFKCGVFAQAAVMSIKVSIVIAR